MLSDKIPYYAVIFTSIQTQNIEGYFEMSQRMVELAKLQPGFLGYSSAKGVENVTISYWQTLDNIANWKSQSEHLKAQLKGRNEWYNWYNVRICKVEREYDFNLS